MARCSLRVLPCLFWQPRQITGSCAPALQSCRFSSSNFVRDSAWLQVSHIINRSCLSFHARCLHRMQKRSCPLATPSCHNSLRVVAMVIAHNGCRTSFPFSVNYNNFPGSNINLYYNFLKMSSIRVYFGSHFSDLGATSAPFSAQRSAPKRTTAATVFLSTQNGARDLLKQEVSG